MTEWIDVHAHLDKLEDPVEVSLQKARDAGVRRVFTIGTEPADFPVVLDIAKKYYPEVYCTLGVHPHEGIVYTDDVGKFIESHINDKEVVAVGEIGLDYYYETSPRAEQQHAFREQLKIAQKYKMPVQIHTRDAEEDTVNILKEFNGEITGIIHCFTGTEWLAKECLALGLNISISGVVTFKNAEELRNVVRMVPLDRMHVETDSPFLAPIPMRGKKNTPAFVVHTAALVADLKGITVEQLAVQTRDNALKIFPKVQW